MRTWIAVSLVLSGCGPGVIEAFDDDAAADDAGGAETPAIAPSETGANGEAATTDTSGAPDASTAPDTSRIPDGPCTPTTCEALGKKCGSAPNGCGVTLECGSCTAPETCGGGSAPGACGGCENLSPAGSATTNRTNIQWCLDTRGKASLNPGVYPIDGAIKVPSNAVLLGLKSSSPTLQRQPGSAGNTLITLDGDGARVASLSLDGNNAWPGTCCDAVVSIGGTKNTVADDRIFNAAVPPAGRKATGIYVVGMGASGNTLSGNEIYNHFYGVIFRAGLTSAQPNTLDGSRIHDIKCDGVTLAGYGKVTSNKIYQNGFDCENGPIPGAAIYSIGNANGATISKNELFDNCGNNLDLVEGSGFEIEGNNGYHPGYQWGGSRAYCKGAVSALLAGVSNSTIKKNTFTNSDRSWNRVGNRAGADWWRATGARPFADVPGGADGVIAFVLARDKGGKPSINNTIDGNRLQAFCTGGCTGVGYFSSRGTGFESSGAWKASFYTGNDPVGSQVGSKRCGGNWFAGSSACSSGTPGPPCNTDDPQHQPPSSDWKHSDLCDQY